VADIRAALLQLEAELVSVRALKTAMAKHPVEPEKLSESIDTDAPIGQGRRITLVLPDATVVTGLHGSILTPGHRGP